MPLPPWYRPEMGSYTATYEHGVLTHFWLNSNVPKPTASCESEGTKKESPTEMKFYTFNTETNAVEIHAKKADAKATELPHFSDAETLVGALTSAQTVALYNSLAEKPVSKFTSKTVGAERTFALVKAKFTPEKKTGPRGRRGGQ